MFARMWIIAVIMILADSLYSQVPNKVNVQAVLRNAAGEVVTGTYTVKFTIYDAQTGGNVKYTQTETLTVSGGFINVYLGPLPSNLFAENPNLYLGIKVGNDPELPRRPFASTGYAFYAERAKFADNAMGPPSDLVCNGCVGTQDLENPLSLAGDLNVQGNVNACLANSTGCGVRVSTEMGIFDRNDGYMNIQAGSGVRIRKIDNSDWQGMFVGSVTSYGTLNLPVVGMSIDTSWGGYPSLSIPGNGEIRMHGVSGQATLRIDGSILIEENSGLQVTGPANLAINTGKVGIGTTSPGSKLTVIDASKNQFEILKGGSSLGIQFHAGDNNTSIQMLKYGVKHAGFVWDGSTIHVKGMSSGNDHDPDLTLNNTEEVQLSVYGNTEVRGTLIMTGGKVNKYTLFEADGGGTGATILYSKAEGAGRLRVGAAWNIPGIYSEDNQDIVVGMAKGKTAKIGTSPNFVEVDSDGNLCLPLGATLKVCGQQQQPPPQQCDGTIWNGYCYKFFAKGGVTWGQGESDCINWGGHMASVHSDAERDFLTNLAGCGPYWLGGHDAGHEGTWVWTDGSPWDYSAWAPGEPNNCCGGENYLHGNWCCGNLWNDIWDTWNGNCGFMCKKPILPSGGGMFSATLSCTTIYGAGSAGSCWGVSYIYCPSGYIMTGGGMAEPNYSFEQSRPCTDQEGQCWVCDNYPGCGSGTCYVRCCKIITSMAFGKPKSCNDIKIANPGAASGVYEIDPDQDGPNPPFNVYCDMASEGGGWTMVMKIDGNSNRFVYHSAYWENDDLYNEGSTNMDPADAKFRSFTTVPFNQIRIGMKRTDCCSTHWITIGKTANNLKEVMKGGYQPTSMGRQAWKAMVDDSSLQYNCNMEGFNTYHSCMWDTSPSGVARVRIGIICNQENDCCSPDSRIGVGGGGSYCGQDQNNASGNEARCSPLDNGDRSLRSHAWIFVR